MCLEKPAGDQFVGAFKAMIRSFLRKPTGTNSEQEMSIFQVYVIILFPEA